MSGCSVPWGIDLKKDKKYIWITEKGKNTCKACKDLNGKIFNGDEVPPRPHPYCKCEIFEYEDYIANEKKYIIETLAVCNVSNHEYLMQVLGDGHSISHYMPHAKQLLFISIKNKLDSILPNTIYNNYIQGYLKNTPAYNMAELFAKNEVYISKNVEKIYDSLLDLPLREMTKRIYNAIKRETPEINDCKVYVFHENSSIAKEIAKSKGLKTFIRNNGLKLGTVRNKISGHIEFTNEDADLYAAIHGATVYDMHFDENKKYLIFRIEDYYNFNPGRTSGKNRLGYKLQQKQKLIPYYIIINMKVYINYQE